MTRQVRSRAVMLPVTMLATVSLVTPAAVAREDARSSATSPPGNATLVQVNGRAITQADLDTAYLVRGIPPERRSAMRKLLLERLVDESLIAQFLRRRHIKPNRAALDEQVERILAFIRRRGEEPEDLLQKLGLNQQQIREQLSLPLAWKTYVRAAITGGQLKSYFEAHRRELDGTEVRARHIVLKVPPGAPAAEWERATKQLDAVRQEIRSGARSFADAARKYSEGPSKRNGGDVGFFAHRGTMPAPFADAAFALALREVSHPVRTNAGVHLIEVTDERPGQLSLEDVRPAVFERLAAQMWEERVAALREQAKIIWTQADDSRPTP